MTRIVARCARCPSSYDHLFTSGGIGPTHDDITADAVAEAMGAHLGVRDDACAILQAHYDRQGMEMNDARLRMARVPDGAILIDNPISAAPGFTLGNVHVMAGVPTIFEAMLASVLPTLTGGPPMLSQSLRVDRGEGRHRDVAGQSGGGASGGLHRLLPVPARRGAWLQRRGAKPGRRGRRQGHGRTCAPVPGGRMTGPADIAATIRATWPPASTRRIGPFDVNDGAGGGNRVSAARLSDPLSDGGAVSPGEVSDVATAQAARGTEALFMVFGWQDPLDRLLAAEGYATRDETLILAAPAADIAEPPAR
jgi:hypothetical protein